MHTKKEIKTSDWKRGKNVDKKEKKQMQQEAYNEYVKQVTPTHNLAANMAKAFLVGGVICVIGQFILNICRNYGLDKDTSGSWCSMLLVLLSVLINVAVSIVFNYLRFALILSIISVRGSPIAIAACTR